jgi:hypothetical protein
VHLRCHHIGVEKMSRDQVKIKVPADVYSKMTEAAKLMAVDEKTFIRVALQRFAEVVVKSIDNSSKEEEVSLESK